MSTELWQPIPEFPTYLISNLGNIYNIRTERLMRTSVNNHGYMKITLMDDETHERHTRAVALLVAQAFVEPPTRLCDHVIILDGDLTNVVATNLAWRPRWYAWKYFNQLKATQPLHYRNLVVCNITTGYYYDSVIQAGMRDGLLFESIWHSTYTREKTFPYGHIYEIDERV